MDWKERLGQLPIIFDYRVPKAGEFIEEDWGKVHLIATRAYTYDWGATYRFSISGNRKSRQALIDELYKEIGDSLTEAKGDGSRHYWWKCYTPDIPRIATQQLLGEVRIRQTLETYGISDEEEKRILLEALLRMDSLESGDHRKAIPPVKVIEQLSKERRLVVAECLLAIIMQMAEFTTSMEVELGRL